MNIHPYTRRFIFCKNIFKLSTTKNFSIVATCRSQTSSNDDEFANFKGLDGTMPCLVKT